MKEVKDNFSLQAKAYATFRPRYPDSLYEFLYSLVPSFDCAWDCATGNGQVAERLSEKFSTVYANDISDAQLQHAVKKPNIHYVTGRSETISFQNTMFDLITIAQAMHWFDHAPFYENVQTVAKPDSILAFWGYHNPKVTPEIDEIIEKFYFVTMTSYWDAERTLIDLRFKTIPLPFPELPAPPFEIVVNWNLEQFLGYLQSWSSVQKYMKLHNANPVNGIEKELQQLWGDEQQVTFPVFMRIGKIKK